MNPSDLDRLVRDALASAHFVAAPTLRLTVAYEPPHETLWEVYFGHLQRAQATRVVEQLAFWNLSVDDRPQADNLAAGATPLIQIAWSASQEQLYVVRNILSHGWETRESAPQVFTSHPVQSWHSELVGTIAPTQRESLAHIAAELAQLMELALVGTSRLPITSVESPAPIFAFGQLAYLPTRDASSTDLASSSCWRTALDRASRDSHVERQARGLEFALRAATPSDAQELADWLAARFSAETAARLFRQVFQQISLAPHTSLLDTLIAVLRALAEPNRFGLEFAVDLVSYMLRHLVRHLTAYDLETFHSFGANYPDALWLDALLKLYVGWIEQSPSTFNVELNSASANEPAERTCRLRRRALRQAWLARVRYEGLRVPDEPTSAGERLRVLPGRSTLVPEEQLLNPAHRRRRLFDGDPLAVRATDHVARALEQAWRDCADSRELLELGTASFVDRPWGIFKDPCEVDRTPFLSFEAVSRRRIEERLELAQRCGLVSERIGDELLARALAATIAGRGVAQLPGASRPGVIMLEDARQASDDFVFTRTTRSSLAALAQVPSQFTAAQRELFRSWSTLVPGRLLIRTAGPREAAFGHPLLTLFRDGGCPEAHIVVVPPADDEPVYREAFGVEYLSAGIRIELVPPS